MAAVDDTAEAQAAQARFNARGRVVLILVVVLIGIQALRSALPTDDDVRLLLNFAFVPAGFARLFDPAGIAASATALIRRDAASTGDVILLLGPNGFRWWTLLTYAFLHGSWTHVLVNGVWLAAFGSAVARRFGGPRFLLFFAVTAVGGALAHSLMHFRDFSPLVGASAAISGAMAASARFAFAPGSPLGPWARRGVLAAYQGPSLPLRFILRDARVVAFLGIWFAVNILFGVLSTPLGLSDAAIAWEAHIGGFLTGLLLFRLFDPPFAPAADSDLAMRPPG